ncbi:hypothetical protein [Streptomyces sp. G-G2]|uniref:hypothetical protein n=1 Tax=Streptomyces sp. G-G2 TaxID=3046201 RepID=UPI0024BA6B2C|nr:hypothetical protein [Streptomyces sp. G-G2]MDJ0381436.1 hypothetical protein [Streptomyces sp. G-G2]
MNRSLTMTTAAVFTGLALFATACSTTGAGSDKKEGSANSSANGSGAGGGGGGDKQKIADDALKMRQCLRGEGIDAPDPKPGEDPRGMTVGGGADQEKLQKAMEKCGMKGPGSGGGAPSQEDADKELAWIQCMRKNGVDLKDPEPAVNGMKKATEIPKGQEKAFQDALPKCNAAS